MTRFRFRWLVLFPLVLLSLVPNRAVHGQDTEAWRQLSLGDFVQQIRELPPPVSEEVSRAISLQSAERLMEAVGAGATGNVVDLLRLYTLARPALSPEQDATARAGLVPSASQIRHVNFWSFPEIEGLMTQAGLPREAIEALSASWLEQQDVRSMDNLVELQWFQEQIHVIDRDTAAPRTFSVTWSGLVRAPA
jgi:hypothetical protein